MRKPISKLLKSIVRLRATLQAFRDGIVRQLAERPAAAGTSYGPVFDHLQAELAAVEPELSVAEDAYDVAQFRAGELREKRGLAVSRLSGEHVPIERLLRCQTHLKGVGAVAGTPQCRFVLARQVRRTARFLRKLEREQPALACGIKIDAGDLAGGLEAGLGRLEASIAGVNEADGHVALAQERANRAFAEAERVVSWVTRTFESLGGLAGDEELGERIRRCFG